MSKPTDKMLCWRKLLSFLSGVWFLFVVGCQVQGESVILPVEGIPQEAEAIQSEVPTPFPTRPLYGPGELVEYVAQSGDTLPALAIHFNTTVDEILEANPIIPEGVTTLPPGMPMRIPIYYKPFWGSPYQILPDSLFVNGPSQVGFDHQTYVDGWTGWFTEYSEYAAGENRTGAGIVAYVAEHFSISPRLLLALLEYQTGALSQDVLPSTVHETYPLGYEKKTHRGLYLQLVWAANTLNNGYYGWRTGNLTALNLRDGTVENPDPWQNAATVALQYYFSLVLDPPAYREAVGPDGFARVYKELFGDPWQQDHPHIPGSLQQPDMLLPFEVGKTWALTGGPHPGWGVGDPWAALDFAPPSTRTGCFPSDEWTTAVASGVVARNGEGILELDLDGDSDVRTGWVVLYLHIATRNKAAVGTVVDAGHPLGHPSCEGGTSTGTHIHIARKYNGEWVPADGPLAFNLEGWIAHNGVEAYQGTLTRFSQNVIASTAAGRSSYITAGE